MRSPGCSARSPCSAWALRAAGAVPARRRRLAKRDRRCARSDRRRRHRPRARAGGVGVILLTIPVGIGIGLAGALMPVAVKERFPDRPAFATGIYATGINTGSAPRCRPRRAARRRCRGLAPPSSSSRRSRSCSRPSGSCRRGGRRIARRGRASGLRGCRSQPRGLDARRDVRAARQSAFYGLSLASRRLRRARLERGAAPAHCSPSSTSLRFRAGWRSRRRRPARLAPAATSSCSPRSWWSRCSASCCCPAGASPGRRSSVSRTAASSR